MEANSEIENIKALYGEIKMEDRKRFHAAIADEFNVEVSSVNSGWFSRFQIPAKYKVRENVIEFMQNYIANKNNVAV